MLRSASKARHGAPIALVAYRRRVFLFVAIGAVVGAYLYEAESSRPIGEGDLFLQETSASAATVIDSGSDTAAVKAARNELEIEAVSVIDAEGAIGVSTSKTLVDTPTDNPVVGFAHSSQTFAAAAMPVSSAIEVDGIEQWASGDTVYAVLYPAGASSVLFHYDISELLPRRSKDSGIGVSTLPTSLGRSTSTPLPMPRITSIVTMRSLCTAVTLHA